MSRDAKSDGYDLFVSYSHIDNRDQWVEAFVDAIRRQHSRFSPMHLRIFLDVSEIRTMQDWEHRILGALRQSRLMLVFLSPAYFQSRYCAREWQVYVDHELDRGDTEGIVPIYIVSVPELDDPAALHEPQKWLLDLRRRQMVDVRAWWSCGPVELQRQDVQSRLERLEQDLTTHLDAYERVAASRSTVPPHSRYFVGRREELRRLRACLALGPAGTIVAVNGIGGVGKSTLASEYASAYANEYSGGRFLVTCEHILDMRVVLLHLATQKGIALSSNELGDLDLAAARVRAELMAGPRTLLVLDNLCEPALLGAGSLRHLPHDDRLHVLVTTRLTADDLPGVECLTLDNLQEREGVRLLEKYRAIDGPAERDAALATVRYLGGYAVALEAVAVYLWRHQEVRHAEYLQRLQREGVAALGTLGRLLDATLESLTPEELLAVKYASLAAPDAIAVPWLRVLVGGHFPDSITEPPTGYPDPWRQIHRRLVGLRLLTPCQDARLCSMHRLVGQVVAGDMTEGERLGLLEELEAHAQQRASLLRRHWSERDQCWEIEPVFEQARMALARGAIDAAAALGNGIQEPLRGIGRLSECRTLLHDVLVAQTRKYGPTHLALGPTCSNLAVVEAILGDLASARELLRRSIAIEESSIEPDQLAIAVRMSNLGAVERELGDLTEADCLLRQALSLQRERLPAGHVALATTMSNLALVEQDQGRPNEARRLLRAALEIEEQALGQEHVTVATTCSNLALVEQRLRNVPEAARLFRRAVSMQKRAFGQRGHDLAIVRANLAVLQRERGKLRSARTLLIHAIATEEQLLGSDHASLAACHANLALIEHGLGNGPEAVRRMQRSYEVAVGQLGERDPQAISARNWLRDHARIS